MNKFGLTKFEKKTEKRRNRKKHCLNNSNVREKRAKRTQ